MATTLRTTLRTTTSCLSTMRWTTRTPSRTWTCTTRSTEHTARRSLIDAHWCHIAPVAQVRLARVIPSMHVHLCLALWLFSPRLSLFSTSSHRSPSSPSRCLPQCSTRGPGPTPCATSAWGPWSPPTMRHPSQKHGWEKIPNWECLFVHREKGLFLSVYVDDIKLAGMKHNIDPMWKVFNKEVDLGELTSFFDHVYLGCTQRQCEISKDIVDNYRTMFESRISAVGLEKLPFPQNIRISSWSYDMAGHAKKCVERYCELANKTTQQLYKVSTPCIDDHHFKEEETKSVGELSNTCSQIVLKC